MIKDCHVGVKGLVCVRDACLLLKSTKGYWDIPGGRIDENETLDDTLRRELREELPQITNFSIGDIVHAYRLSKNIDDEKGLVLLFYKVDAESFDVVLSDEHQEYRWITRDTLPEFSVSGVPIEPGYYEAVRKVLE